MSHKQLVYDFQSGLIVEEVSKQGNQGLCVISLPDLKSHTLSSIKFYCMSVCESDSCKGCSLDSFRLFISRMPPSKYYSAAHESSVTVVDTEGRVNLPSKVMSEIEQSTRRFGIRSSFTRTELKHLMTKGVEEEYVQQELALREVEEDSQE